MVKTTDDDSMPLEFVDENSSGKLTKLAGVKVVIFLFFIFILISSDLFISNILRIFKGSTNGPYVSTYGTIIQGIFLVILFITGLYLFDAGIF